MPGLPRALLFLVTVLGACSYEWKAVDVDGDGVTPEEGDCWDAVDGPEGTEFGGGDISPNVAETWYDGVDQNCDGLSDFDADADGYTPAGYGVGSGDDCDDADALSYPGALDTWYDGVDSDCGGEDDYDQDGDGHAATGYDGVDGDDCDDLDAAINPESTETWYDGVDQDCGGEDDYDQDGDGFILTEDCDDTDDTKVPDGSPEDWSDCDDDNCDGNAGDQDDDGYVSDEFAAACPDWEIHNGHLGAGDCWDSGTAADHDAVPVNDFPELTAGQVSPEAVETWYDGVDQDCAGDDDFDQDADDFRTDEYPDTAGELGEDCIDGADLDDEENPAGLDPSEINPLEAETWYDGTDQDCAGDDDYDQDYDGYQAEGYGEGSDDDCDDSTDDINPGVNEECDTSYDDNCDGDDNDLNANDCSSFYVDGDLDTYGAGSAYCYCEAPSTSYVTNDDDCKDSDADINPGETEGTGDEVDQNCDNKEKCYVDADNDEYRTTSTSSTVTSSDSDCDDSGEAASSLPATDCDDDDDTINPGETEVVGDEIDQTCDGKETCYSDADDDEYRSTTTTTTVSSSDSDCDDTTEAASSLPATDCNDSSASINPGATETVGDEVDQTCDSKEKCYVDSDDDEYRTTSTSSTVTSSDSDCDDSGEAASSLPATDCDDGDDDINPGETEVVGDEVDQTCDSKETCYVDSDNDEYRTTSTSSTVTSTDSDCDDVGEAASSLPATDCDDGDDEINPGEAEVVGDEVDQTCDSKETCYVDSDNDEYRTTSTSSTVTSTDSDCDDAGEAASSLPATDCDDSSGTISPGATEVVGDEIDQTCDNKETCYVDSDADGQRTTSTSTTVVSSDKDCDDAGEAPSTYAATDCDDGDGAVYDGAPETCEDDQVNDCSGDEADAQDECLDPTYALTDATTKRNGATAGDASGTWVAMAGSDVLVGTPGYNGDDGAFYLLEGPLATGTTSLTGATAQIIGETGSDGALGSAGDLSGDLDDDGFLDLVLGAPEVDASASVTAIGATYVLYGPVSGSVTLSSTTWDLKLLGEDKNDRLGASIITAGDLDEDGTADLFVGCDRCEETDGDDTNEGKIYIYLGPVSGTETLAGADAIITGTDTQGYIGGAVATLDANADGASDVLIGGDGVNVGSKTDAGIAYLLYGSLSGAVSTTYADLTVQGGAKDDYLGTAVAGGGDVNADGYDDLLLGAIGVDGSATDTGAAYLFHGEALGSASTVTASTADATLSGAATNDVVGGALSLCSDVNGDAYADVLLGVAEAGSDGAAYLYYGPVSGSLSLSAADVVFSGENSGDDAGTAVAGCADVDADGYDDLAIGAPGRDPSSVSDAGQTYFILGTSY